MWTSRERSDDPDSAYVLRDALGRSLGPRGSLKLPNGGPRKTSESEDDPRHLLDVPSEVPMEAFRQAGKDALPILSEALWCLLDETADELLAELCGCTVGDSANSAALADVIGVALIEAADGLGGSRHVAASLVEAFEVGIRDCEDAGPLVEALEAAMGEINDPRVLLGSLFDACTDFITVGSSIWFPTRRAHVWEACCRTLSATSGPMATTKVLLKVVEDTTRRDWNLDPTTRALVKALTRTTMTASDPAAVVRCWWMHTARSLKPTEISTIRLSCYLPPPRPPSAKRTIRRGRSRSCWKASADPEAGAAVLAASIGNITPHCSQAPADVGDLRR